MLRARETNVREARQASSQPPEPTSAPSLARAKVVHGGLIRRSLDYDTCGYVDGVSQYSLTCGAGSGCYFWPVGPFYSSFSVGNTGAINCCPISSGSYVSKSCVPETTCIDYNTRYNTGADSIVNDQTIYCGSGARKCATLQFQGGRPSWSSNSFGASLAAEVYTNMYCSDVSTVEFVYQSYTTALSSSSSIAESSSSSQPPSSSVASTASTSSSSASVAADASGGSKGSSNDIAIIAGATVGGVVALVAIVAVLWYLIWRKKREYVAPPDQTREISSWMSNSTAYDPSLYGNNNAYAYPKPGY